MMIPCEKFSVFWLLVIIMGNTATKEGVPVQNETKEEVVTKQRPSLVRMTSTCEEYDCSLCLGKEKKGLACLNEHFICKDCFSPYVNSVCEERFKLIEAGGKIKCPVPDCKSEPWSSHDVLQVASKDVVEHYIDILMTCMGTKLDDGTASKGSDKDKKPNAPTQVPDDRAIVDALVLLCPNPNCRNQIPQVAPVNGLILATQCVCRCTVCGIDFCLLCLHIKSSKENCSTHVAFACLERQGVKAGANYAVIVDAAHKRRRLEAIRRTLQQRAEQHEREQQATAVGGGGAGGGGAGAQAKAKAGADALAASQPTKNQVGFWSLFGSGRDDSKLPPWQRSRYRKAVEACAPILKGSNITPKEVFASDQVTAPGRDDLNRPMPVRDPATGLFAPPLLDRNIVEMPNGGNGNVLEGVMEWRSKRNSKLVVICALISLVNLYSGLMWLMEQLATGYERNEMVEYGVGGVVAFIVFVSSRIHRGGARGGAHAEGGDQGGVQLHRVQLFTAGGAIIACVCNVGLCRNALHWLSDPSWGEMAVVMLLWVLSVALTSMEVMLALGVAGHGGGGGGGGGGGEDRNAGRRDRDVVAAWFDRFAEEVCHLALAEEQEAMAMAMYEHPLLSMIVYSHMVVLPCVFVAKCAKQF